MGRRWQLWPGYSCVFVCVLRGVGVEAHSSSATFVCMSQLTKPPSASTAAANPPPPPPPPPPLPSPALSAVRVNATGERGWWHRVPSQDAVADPEQFR